MEFRGLMRLRNITGDTGQTGKSVLSSEAVQLEMNSGSFFGLRLTLQHLQRKGKKPYNKQLSAPWPIRAITEINYDWNLGEWIKSSRQKYKVLQNTKYIQNYSPKFWLFYKVYSAPVSKSCHAKSKLYELQIASG